MASQTNPQLTELAVDYSHPLQGRDPIAPLGFLRQNHEVLLNGKDLKSGLTPLDPADYRTEQELNRYDILLGYQRQRFRGESPLDSDWSI
jgi:hypothetical protein